jgi:hypothetical protein
MAIDKEAPMFQRAAGTLQAMAQGLTLGWLGGSAELYAEDHPVWDEMVDRARDASEDEEAFEEIFRLPIAARVAATDGFRLTAFLASLRGLIDQVGPGMTVWTPLEHEGQPYVRVSPSEAAVAGVPADIAELAIYYAPASDALTVSLREDVLKRALDRQRARREAAGEEGDHQPPGTPWLGSSLALQVDRRMLEVYDALTTEFQDDELQRRSWGNIPILNEWKRLYPDENPVELHERIWKVRLVCPGGGQYVWNEEFHTMESTVYGHPGAPKSAGRTFGILEDIARGSFGLTFENDGLRARAILER